MSTRRTVPIQVLVALAQERWPAWFGRAPSRLRALVAAGGPAHRARVLVMLLEGSRGKPQVFAKVALDDREATFVEREAAALAGAHASLPSDLLRRVPEPLGCEAWEGSPIAFSAAMPGCRVGDPVLRRGGSSRPWRVYDRFLEQSLGWSSQMGACGSAAVGSDPLTGTEMRRWVLDFSQRHGADGAPLSALVAFAEAVGGLGVLPLTPTWQHGDLALSNSLLDRGEFRFLDWEHAGPGWEPWADLGSAPLALLAVARRQSRLPADELAAWLLGGDHPAGVMLRRRMEERWVFPIPMAWGVVLSCVRRSLLRAAQGREVEPWAALAMLLLTDPGTQRAIPWLVPRW